MTRTPPVDSARFPPITPAALHARGHRRPDVLLVSGDAYVDHPSFGAAVVARLLESFGLSVAVAPQPDWRHPEPLAAFGRPRLFVGITAGNMDSMVNHLTAHKKRRHQDAYSPGGRPGLRPNRATVVYAQLARRAFPDCLLVLGGVEASLRRFAHYDYWADQLRRSVLLDAKADLLVFGMAERPLRAVVDRLGAGGEATRRDLPRLYGIRGTAFALGDRELDAKRLPLANRDVLTFGAHGWAAGERDLPSGGPFRDPPRPVRYRVRRLPSWERLQAHREALALATRWVERTANPALGEACVQRHGAQTVLVMPPAFPLSTPELDTVHELPFERAPHPDYAEPIPAFAPMAHSVQTTRGCFGGCSFCAIALHEGRAVVSRSEASVLREIQRVAALPSFRGTLSDLGGPTANTYGLGCSDPRRERRCRRPSCLHPRICPFLRTDHTPLRRLLRAARDAPGVRQVHIASGVRHDLALLSPGFLEDLVRHHVGGHLHVAPEHDDPEVLRLARKPRYDLFDAFRRRFDALCDRADLPRYLNPYFISGLPGSTDARMAHLVARLRAEGWRPQQVQSFMPTPGSAATAMFYSGVSPDGSGEPVAMPRRLADKIRQHGLLTEGLPRRGEHAGKPTRRSHRRQRRGPASRAPSRRRGKKR